MALTYTAIATVTVGSGGASNIEFTSIPGTYTDLCLLVSARDSRADDATNYSSLQLNGNTTNVIKLRSMLGGGGNGTIYNDSDSTTPVTNGTASYAATIPTNAATASTFGNFQMYFPNYTSSNYKSVSVDAVNESNASTLLGTFLGAIVFQTTSAITSIKLGIGYTTAGGGGTYQQYSTATLYGIKNTV